MKKINHFSIIWTLSDPCKLFKYALKTIQINNIYTHIESRYTDSKNESEKVIGWYVEINPSWSSFLNIVIDSTRRIPISS